MLGWCILCCAPRLKGEHWSDDFRGIRVDNGDIAEGKNKFEDLNVSQYIGSILCHATFPVVKILR